MQCNLGSPSNKTWFKIELYGIEHLLTELVEQDRKTSSSLQIDGKEVTALHLYFVTLVKQTIFLFDQPTPTQSIKRLPVVYFSLIMSHDDTWSIKMACTT